LSERVNDSLTILFAPFDEDIDVFGRPDQAVEDAGLRAADKVAGFRPVQEFADAK